MKRSKILLFLLLIIFEIISLFLTYKSFSNKEIKEVKEINKINNKQFSMFIETDNGYEEYLESNKFPEGYTINLEESKCLDTKGNVIEGILSGSGTNITVTSKTTSYCYLYFDIPATKYLIDNSSSAELWESTLEDDGYRYVGTNPNNYVCFGYENATTDCDFTNATNTDLYAYRIIGIFEDSEGTPHIKLIKKEALNTLYKWHNDSLNRTYWSESDLYKGLNGISGGGYNNIFTNSSNLSYMSTSSDWYKKIEIWDYTATYTKTYESGGPNYYYQYNFTVSKIYLHEMNRTGNINPNGEWNKVSAKIGLMYVSDYLLSLGSTALSYIPQTNASELKTGWMHITNNDNISTLEWTIATHGFDEDNYDFLSWDISSSGFVGLSYLVADYIVRPVFYLTSDVNINGEGTIESPYIIS